MHKAKTKVRRGGGGLIISCSYCAKLQLIGCYGDLLFIKMNVDARVSDWVYVELKKKKRRII